MADAAVWYLVLQALVPLSMSQGPRQYIGPVTEAQCQKIKAVVSDDLGPACKKAVSMVATSYGPVGYAFPVFEGEGFVSTHAE